MHTVEVPRKDIHASYPWGPLVYFRRAWPLAKSLIKNGSYDLCHAVFGLPAGAVAWRIAREYQLPYLVSLRGSDVPGYDAAWRWVHVLSRPLNKRVWRCAARLVANSKALRNLAIKATPGLDIGVIYNGVDSSLFKPLTIAKERPRRRLRLISVCRLVERKGLQHVLAALVGLPGLPAELTVVGSGDYRRELEGRSQTYGLSDKVHFIGHVPNEELPAVYTEHDAFIMPSLTESHAMVLTEAMSCGLPVIGSTAGAIPEVIRVGIDGLLVEPGDVQQIETAIVQLAEDNELREKMGRAARRRVQEKFTWSKIADQYEKLYDKVATDSR